MRLGSIVSKVFIALSVFLSLTACQPDTPNPKKNSSGELVGFVAHDSLAFGRQSAAYYHLSQVWRISHMDGLPMGRLAHIDLTQISQGLGFVKISERCRPISVLFDTHHIAAGQIYVIRIERTLDDCSDDFEDKLMSIVADTRRLEKASNGQMVLISYGHTLTLSPEPRK